jgi:hypothetical protein
MQKILRYPIVLPAIALYLYVAGSAPFLGQWDSYDYLKHIVSHQLSALGFGRPVFLGYNILLWESVRRIFHLEPLKVEAVVMTGTVLLGVAGLLLFRALARQFLSPRASRMAALALAVSPIYAVYSGFIMTEVPMLVALIGSGLILCKSAHRHPVWGAAASGILFGMAFGMREQALTLGAAYLWIIWSKGQTGRSRVRSILLFGSTAMAAVLVPVLWLYFSDPAGFVERTRIWLRAIPMGQSHFAMNVQASLLYALAICPASWSTAAAAGLYVLFRRRASGKSVVSGREPENSEASVKYPVLGIFCSIVLPIVALWRDADVQIHPRYAMVALPGSLLFCACIYDRWIRSGKGPVLWAAVHVLVFGAAILILSPFRQVQSEKMEFAEAVRNAVPGKAVFIAGSYSPMLDYYRGIGVRPQWQIVWSGWDWNQGKAEGLIRESWAAQVPVYLSEDPLGWRHLESEYLNFYFFLKDCKKEPAIPKLFRIYPK